MQWSSSLFSFCFLRNKEKDVLVKVSLKAFIKLDTSSLQPENIRRHPIVLVHFQNSPNKLCCPLENSSLLINPCRGKENHMVPANLMPDCLQEHLQQSSKFDWWGNTWCWGGGPCVAETFLPVCMHARLLTCFSHVSFNPIDYNLPGSSVHGILQAWILEWVAMLSSRESSWPRDRTCVSCKFLALQVNSLLLGHWRSPRQGPSV